MRVGLSSLLVLIVALSLVAADDNFITVEEGNLQSTYLNNQFAQQLRIIVKTSQGQPAKQVQVTLLSPPTGASALFNSATGSFTHLASTDSDGRVSVNVFANSIVGSYSITVRAPGATPAQITLYNNANPATVTVVSGTGQSAVVNTLFGNKLVGRLTDASGLPVVFVGVTLDVQANANGATGAFPGDLTSLTINTDNSGNFETSIQAGKKIGSYKVVSRVNDNPSAIPATWNLVNTYDAGYSIASRSGQNQVTTVNTNFKNPLVAVVTDQFGNPVPGITVTFQIPRDAAAFGSFLFVPDAKTATSVTNVDGVATSPTIAANAVSGGYTASASATLGGSVKTAPFELYNNPNYETLTYTVVSPKVQITTIANQMFTEDLVLQVTDPGLNPVPNVTISFQAPTDPLGATCYWGEDTSYVTRTNGTGHAVAPAPRASTIKGNFGVLYNPDSPSRDPFSLLVNPDVPATITAKTGSDPTIVNREFKNPLLAIVRDQFGNGVPNTPVWFYREDDEDSCSAPENPQTQLTDVPSLLFNNVRCSKNIVGDSVGSVLSLSPLRINQVAGTYKIVAVVALENYDVKTTFTLTNLPEKAVSLEIVGAATKQAQVGEPFDNLKVAAYDVYHNLVPGVTVNFWAPQPPVSATIQSSAVTGTGLGASGDLGVAQTTAVALERPGTFQVTANSTGINNEVSFTLTSVVNDPHLLHFEFGASAQAVVDQLFADTFKVLVTDLFGNPVEDVTVQFEVPDTDESASGYFTDDSTRVTDEDGFVTLVGDQDFKANKVAGEYQLKVTVPGFNVEPIFSNLVNLPADPDHFDVLFPNPANLRNEAVVTGVHFPSIRLYLLDQFNNVVPNQPVQFKLQPGVSLGAGIPSGLFVDSNALIYTPQTNASGYVSARQIRANQYAGTFTVEVSVPDFADNPDLSLNFLFYNKPATPHRIESNYDESAAQATVAEQFDSLELTVYDEYDNTVLDDVTVELWIGESESDRKASAYFLDGTDKLTFWSLTTDKSGKAEAPALYANQFSGTYTLTIDAMVGEAIYGSPLYIDLTNVPGPVTLIDVLSGANQHVKVTENYQPIVVQLFDKFNNTVNYRDLTFEVDAQDDPSAGFGGDNTYTDSSNGQGIVTSGILTANQFAGEFLIYVSIDGAEISIPQLNIPNDPAYFVFDEADVREAVVDNNFADPIGVTVYDAYNNVVYDTPVTFTAPVSGASLFFEESVTNYTLVTNSAGYVNTGDLLANTISGAFKVSVACPGFFAPESVSFTSKPDAAYRFAFLTPDYRVLAMIETQSDKINVLVLDQFDNPVPGTSVTFTVVPNPSNSAGGSFQSSGTTSTGVSDANGVVTPVNAFIANSVASSYTIVASADGLDDIDIPVQNVNNVPDIISQSTPDQVVQAGTVVDNPLFVVVLDQGSNAATGYGVTFATPSTGPSCFFANNRNSALVIIDETGRAQAPNCTANGVLGQFSVTATAIGDLSVDMHVTVVVGDATNIAVSGDKQSVQVTQSFTSIEVTVTDSFGNVVPGVQVTFRVPSSGASATIDGQSSLVLATGPNGKVSTNGHTLTANTVAGTWILDVTVQGIVTPKQVTLTNTPAAANMLTLVSGGNQSTTVATSFGNSIVIRANDQYNNVVPGSSVTLTAPSTAASLLFSNNQNTITGTTGVDGTYTVSAPTASTGAGTYTIAVTGAKDLTFSMTNTAGAVAQFTRQGSSSRTAKVNTAYTETFSVLAADKYGNPRSGISVTFSAPASSATGSFTGFVLSYTTTTNTAGVATSSTFTANIVAGQFSVSVNTTSVSTTLTFACENEAGAAALIGLSSGNGQSVKPAASLSPLAVIVSDQYANPVTGASVAFTAPTTGSRLTFSGTNTASGTTDSDGVVSTVAPVAGTVAGSFKVTATSGTLSTQFSLTIVPGSPAALAIVSGSSQSAVVDTPFDAAIVVNVTDQYNNAVPNVAVVFNAPASGPSATFVNGTVLSDAQGVATSSSFTATTTAGSFAVSVSAPGATSVNVPLLNRPAAPSQVIVSSKPTSSAVVGTEFAELAVLVKDQYDNTVSGVEVTFTAPATGASGVFNQSQSRQATSVTGSNGVATSPFFIANTVSGSYSVNATVSGVASVASFTLTNEPDVAFAVSISSGDAQSTSPSTQFAQPLYVLVKDKYNNPVAGVSVTFTILGNSSSVFANGLTTSTALSSVSGRAASPLITAGTTTGSFNVVANVTSIGSVTFSLSITQPPVAAPSQAPITEEPIAAPVSVSAPTAGTSPIPQDAGTISSSNTVVVNSVAVLLATVFYICF